MDTDFRLGVRRASLLFLLVLLLLALLGAARWEGGGRLGAEMDDQASPGLLLIPLKASEVGLLELVIGLEGLVYARGSAQE